MRRIDADALFMKQKSHADLFKGSDKHDDIIRRDEATMALAEIQNAPTIEPEVRHGRWEKHADCLEYCTNCSAVMSLPHHKFCGNCGARMDGGADS